MRVLYISSPGLGGANVSLALLINELSHQEVKAKVIVPLDSSVQLFRKYGVDAYNVDLRLDIWPSTTTFVGKLLFFPRFLYHFLVNVKAFAKINKIVAEFRPDIIHTNVSVISLGYKIARKHSIPHVWHIREYGTKDFGWKLYPSFTAYCDRLADSFSISITKDILKHFNISPLKGRVIYNGIRHKFSSLEPYGDRQSFLYVGSITEKKGFSELIQAYCIYFQNGGRELLIVAGTGKEKYIQEQKRYLNDYGCLDYVNFLGHSDSIDSLMRSAKALIVPSLNEGFGRITAEAMFNGCIVIGKNTGGTKEQFDNGLNLCNHEIGIRYNSYTDLAEVLISFPCISEKELDCYRHNAFVTVNSLYTIEKNANEVMGLYNHILK